MPKGEISSEHSISWERISFTLNGGELYRLTARYEGPEKIHRDGIAQMDYYTNLTILQQLLVLSLGFTPCTAPFGLMIARKKQNRIHHAELIELYRRANEEVDNRIANEQLVSRIAANPQGDSAETKVTINTDGSITVQGDNPSMAAALAASMKHVLQQDQPEEQLQYDGNPITEPLIGQGSSI